MNKQVKLEEGDIFLFRFDVMGGHDQEKSLGVVTKKDSENLSLFLADDLDSLKVEEYLLSGIEIIGEKGINEYFLAKRRRLEGGTFYSDIEKHQLSCWATYESDTRRRIDITRKRVLV